MSKFVYLACSACSEELHYWLLKEVIQPLLPQRLPCYDFTPIIGPTVSDAIPKGLGDRFQAEPTFVV